MSEIRDAIQTARAGNHHTHFDAEVARDVLETQFALSVVSGLLAALIDSRLPVREHMEMLRMMPEHTWNMARDMVKHKYPKLYPADYVDEEGEYLPIGEGSFHREDYGDLVDENAQL